MYAFPGFVMTHKHMQREEDEGERLDRLRAAALHINNRAK